MLTRLLITKESKMKTSLSKFIFGLSILSGMFSYCSTGADPEAIIDDEFTVPLEYCLSIQNAVNDMVMNVNAIVMNNLNTKKDTITDDELAACVIPVIFRTEELIDSIVITYGKTGSCSSNGGSFKGEMIVTPENSNLQNFEISLRDFVANGFDVTGTINFQIEGNEHGRNFSISSNALQFSVTDSEDQVFSFSVLSTSANCTYLRSEDGDADYMDDLFQLSENELRVLNPGGTLMSLQGETDFTYAYSCNNIIGGNALFVLEDFGEGKVDFGSGDPYEDCDSNVAVSAEGVLINIQL